jgi:hypothetical protein
MRPDPVTELVERSLRHLPAIAPDRARGDRLRMRCHAELARGRTQAQRAVRRAEVTDRILGPALVVALCAVYLAAVLGNALRLHGVI